MLSLLLKPKNLLIILGIVLVGYSFYAFNKITSLKAEQKRVTDNFNNALEKDSLETVIYTIRKKNELENILNQNADLKKLVEKSEIKLKRIEGLYYQTLTVKNNSDQSYDVSEMVDKIVKNIDVTKRWSDSTKCQITKGYVSYKQGSLNVGVDYRESTNNITLIKHKGRREKIKWLLGLRLGHRDIKFTPEADCGKIKVTIVEKE